MPSTPKYAIPYPALTDVPDVPYWNQQQAQQVEATLQTLVAAQGSDATYPQAVAGVTAETVIDRISIAAVPYPRRIHVVSNTFVAVSVANTSVNYIIYAGLTQVGYARKNVVAASPAGDLIMASGRFDLAANVAVVVEARVQRSAGTGTLTTTATTALTNTNLLMMRT